MAKKIIWTHTAIEDRFKIYQFWLDRTKSNTYSNKLEHLFTEGAKLISKFPEIGRPTDFDHIRAKIIQNYLLFYLIQSDSIQIIRVWDTRQNPENLEIKQS